MPATVRPDLPPLVDAAIDAFGSRVRVAVIRSLTLDGPATRSELAGRLDVSTSLLQAHLKSLEEQRVVYVSPSREEPGRLHRRYHVEATRVSELSTALVAALLDPNQADTASTSTPSHRNDGSMLSTAQVAKLLNIKPTTWTSYVARGQAPAADGHFDARTPWWNASTIDHWRARRPRRPSS